MLWGIRKYLILYKVKLGPGWIKVNGRIPTDSMVFWIRILVSRKHIKKKKKRNYIWPFKNALNRTCRETCMFCLLYSILVLISWFSQSVEEKLKLKISPLSMTFLLCLELPQWMQTSTCFKNCLLRWLLFFFPWGNIIESNLPGIHNTNRRPLHCTALFPVCK